MSPAEGKPRSEAEIAAEARRIAEAMVAEEISVTIVALILLHSLHSNSAIAGHPDVNAESIWDGARKFVEAGKAKLRVNVIAEMAKR
jgi:hypothetical protein